MADFVPKRIDRDPAILMGITAPESKIIAAIAGLVGLVVFVLVTIFVSLTAALLAFMVVFTIFLFGGVKLLAAYKRNKPRNYVQHIKHVFLEKIFGLKAPFIHQSTEFKSTRD